MNINKEIDNIITLQYNANKNANIGDVCVQFVEDCLQNLQKDKHFV